MNTAMKNKSFQRYSNWKAAAVVTHPGGRINMVVSTIIITLQFPVTQTGWKRIEDTLKYDAPGCLVTLLALTPYEPDNGEDH